MNHLRDRNADVRELVADEGVSAASYVREILDVAHGRRLWSEAAKERWRLRDIEAITPAARVKRLGKKLLCSIFANQNGLELLSHLEHRLSNSEVVRSYREYFRASRPRLVFNGSHVHSKAALAAVHAAKSLGIPTATFLFSWDNLTSQGRIIPTYDYYLVWNDQIKDQLLEIYPRIAPSQVIVTGTPQFDFHLDPALYWSREKLCRELDLDPSRPIVLYSTGMANHIAGEEVIIEAIADMLAQMSDLGPPQLLVREYAKGPSDHLDDLKRRRSDIRFPRVRWEKQWLTPEPEDVPLLTNTLKYADVGINVASTISLELCMFDVPVINVSYIGRGVKVVFDYRRYYEFEHYRPLVESGAIDVVRDENRMPQAIREALTQRAARSAQRIALVEQMFGPTLDGKSGQRVAEALLRLATADNRESALR
ncbi:MAG: hypothetical protein ACK47B_00405 [Armatimonadota bacterium]